MSKPLVAVVMGSASDLPVMAEAEKVLEDFGISYELAVMSAHRSPVRTAKFSQGAKARGLEVIIVGSGAAAHLAGVIAAQTTLPVIAVPIEATPLGGIDALLSTVQMPKGIPVATMAIGPAGAANAALMAAQIMAPRYPKIGANLERHRRTLAKMVETADRELKIKYGKKSTSG